MEKFPAVIELGTCKFVNGSYTYCATEILNRLWRYRLFHNAYKSPCDALSLKVEVTRCRGF